MRIRRQQVDDEPVLDGSDALGEPFDQNPVHCEGAVDIGHEVVKPQAVPSRDAQLDHFPILYSRIGWAMTLPGPGGRQCAAATLVSNESVLSGSWNRHRGTHPG